MPERRSALAHARPVRPVQDGAAVVISEIAHTGKLNLRGDIGDRAFLSAIGGVLDLVLPAEPNTVTTGHGVTALWAGPDEWILVTPPGDELTVEKRLHAAIDGTDAAVIDVTDARTVIRLRGPRAREVIAKGCPLDLHPRAFRAGQVAQSVLAGTSIMLHQVADDGDGSGPAYDLYVPRSFADHLWQWLADAAAEYDAEFRVTGRVADPDRK